VAPVTDSIAILTARGAGYVTMLLPLGGTGRPLDQGVQLPLGWSPDGGELVFGYSNSPPYDLGIINVASDAVRQIPRTPASEEATEWTADGATLLFRRVTPASRITTADVTRLLRRK
jgi:hypothetical protein